uniref:Uncharacterized protein n=1 Tax=Trichobilharzia regenti TaxID=157069 RepID=A0AA85KJW2_TRIRE|nr:unnamed protein product [Trichobilharzia regenti]
MTYLGGIGCALVGLGPCLVLFLFTIVNNPIKVILLTASGFFWLLSLLTTSLIWFIATPLRGYLAFGILIGVLVQEVLRFLFFLLVIKAESGLQIIVSTSNPRRSQPSSQRQSHLSENITNSNANNQNNNNNNTTEGETIDLLRNRVVISPTPCITSITNDPTGDTNNHNSNNDNNGNCSVVSSRLALDHHIIAYVSGLGYGLMSCLTQLLRILIDSFGPGILMHTTSWDSKTFFLTASFDVMCMSMLQVFWSLILFNAFLNRLYGQMIFVYIMHMGLAALSLMNSFTTPFPELVCTMYAISLIGIIAFSYIQFHKGSST